MQIVPKRSIPFASYIHIVCGILSNTAIEKHLLELLGASSHTMKWRSIRRGWHSLSIEFSFAILYFAIVA